MYTSKWLHAEMIFIESRSSITKPYNKLVLYNWHVNQGSNILDNNKLVVQEQQQYHHQQQLQGMFSILLVHVTRLWHKKNYIKATFHVCLALIQTLY